MKGPEPRGGGRSRAVQTRDLGEASELDFILTDYDFKSPKKRRILRAWDRTNKGPGDLHDILYDESVPTNIRRSMVLQMFGQEEMERIFYPNRTRRRASEDDGGPRHPVKEKDDMVDVFLEDYMKALRIKNIMSVLGGYNQQNHSPGYVQVPVYEPDEKTGEVRMKMSTVPVNQGTDLNVQVLKIIGELIKREQKGEKIGAKDLLEALKTGSEMARNARPNDEAQRKQLDMMAEHLDRLKDEFLHSQINLIEESKKKEIELLRQQMQEMGLDADLERLKKYKEAGLVGGSDPEVAKLNARMQLAQWDREFQEKKLNWEMQKEERERMQNADTLNKLVELGTEIVKEIGRPISEAVGDGLKGKMAQGPTQLTPEQREQMLRELDEVQRQAEEAKRRLNEQAE